MSGLSAAFGLTSAPDWQQQYEITVLQLGWRLGGKGASGRNSDAQERIEEHGLHVWGGFYENAFRIMRACYAELHRPPGSPLGTFEEAFKPCPLVSWIENLNGAWLPWNNDFPEYAGAAPGDGQPMPSLFDGLLRVLEWVIQTAFSSSLDIAAGSADTAQASGRDRPAWIEPLVAAGIAASEVRRLTHDPALDVRLKTGAFPAVYSHLVDAFKILRTLPDDIASHSLIAHQAAVWLLQEFRKCVLPSGRLDGEPVGIRRALILVDLGLAEVIGILSDGVLFDGFDVLDNEDLSAWFTRHGASAASVSSAVVRGVYDFIFAFQHGDPAQPMLAAGAGLRCIFRLIMWYKGAIFWKMQAGMGDTVFGPLYQVLRERGVSFEFFQQVQTLELSQDKTSIQSIQVGVQATLKTGSYQPLVSVEGLPCWPNAPLYEQLVQGQELQAQGINLEDPWANWPLVSTYTLTVGVDFDQVILATSLAPLKNIAQELIDASPAFTNLVERVQTVQTQAFQLWLNPNLASLGWEAGSTVLTSFAHPFETWADMSQVTPREVWPPGQQPGSIAYFCGVLIDANPIPPFSDHGFPAQQIALAKQYSLAWIKQNLPILWPRAATNTGTFDWTLVDDPGNQTGPGRFDSQYWRANISPAERYVLSVPGSTQYRLTATGSGFQNLFLAGDWTLNGLNFGCIESATMGGLQVSQAICGYPQEIVGEKDI